MPTYSLEQTLLRDTGRDFAPQRVQPLVDEINREHRFPQDAWENGVELRLLGLRDPNAAATAIRMGGLDLLIGAVGVVDAVHRSADFSPEEFRSDVEINLLSQCYVAQAAYRALREAAAPAIVIFSSVAGDYGLPGQALYAAADAGVMGLTRSMGRGMGRRRDPRQCTGAGAERHSESPEHGRLGPRLAA